GRLGNFEPDFDPRRLVDLVGFGVYAQPRADAQQATSGERGIHHARRLIREPRIGMLPGVHRDRPFTRLLALAAVRGVGEKRAAVEGFLFPIGYEGFFAVAIDRRGEPDQPREVRHAGRGDARHVRPVVPDDADVREEGELVAGERELRGVALLGLHVVEAAFGDESVVLDDRRDRSDLAAGWASAYFRA